MLTKHQALAIFGILWALGTAVITWKAFNRTVTYCVFGDCGSPIDQPFELGWWLGRIAWLTVILIVVVTATSWFSGRVSAGDN